MQKPVVIVGAGIAGLVCARRLEQAGVNILLLDSSDAPGGRMRTDDVDGFQLDRGFQVYFENYPNARLELNESELHLRTFEPGCLVFDGKRMREVHRENLIQTVLSRWLPISDMMRLHQIGDELDQLTPEQVWDLPDQSVEEFLASRNLSKTAIDRFIRPFFGGVFLDRSLNVSCLPLAFYWQMLDRGPATIPASGMQAIPDQIAAGIRPESMRFGARVDSIIRKDGKVCGVKLKSGEVIDVESVIIATDQPSCSRLTGVGTPQAGKSCTTVHFATSEKLTEEAILVVNGAEGGRVNHVACMSVVSKSLAPSGQHLVSATILESPNEADQLLADSARYELRSWFPNQKVESWRPLRVDRILYAQLPQPVGFRDHLPNINPEPGLILAGEHTTYAGIDGAVLSGQQAAIKVLNEKQELITA